MKANSTGVVVRLSANHGKADRRDAFGRATLRMDNEAAIGNYRLPYGSESCLFPVAETEWT